MPDFSSPMLAFDRYIWLAIGVFAIYATYTTQSQLKTFKKRCISPSPSSSDAVVDWATEDGSSSSSSRNDSRVIEQILTIDSTAIKLETLEALARGINFDLRNAALKIIIERAATANNIEFLLNQIEGHNVPARLRALKVMRCLSESASTFAGLCSPRTFRAFLACLNNTLPPTADAATQREAIYILARLMRFFHGKEMAVEAGIVEWLQKVKVPGYRTVVHAVLDLDRFDTGDLSLWEIVTVLLEEYDSGKKLLIYSGLVTEDESERGLEDNPEANLVVVAMRRAQSARGQVEALEAQLQGDRSLANQTRLEFIGLD